MRRIEENTSSLLRTNTTTGWIKAAEWGLRVGISGTFLGHGVFALGVKPNWIPLITTFGFSEEAARMIMPVIGVADITVALFMLIYPARPIVMWACVWAFAAALSRPIAGEPIWEFIERAANWVSPLALLMLQKATEEKRAANSALKNILALTIHRIVKTADKIITAQRRNILPSGTLYNPQYLPGPEAHSNGH